MVTVAEPLVGVEGMPTFGNAIPGSGEASYVQLRERCSGEAVWVVRRHPLQAARRRPQGALLLSSHPKGIAVEKGPTPAYHGLDP
jgi:hypothetical protein